MVRNLGLHVDKLRPWPRGTQLVLPDDDPMVRPDRPRNPALDREDDPQPGPSGVAVAQPETEEIDGEPPRAVKARGVAVEDYPKAADAVLVLELYP